MFTSSTATKRSASGAGGEDWPCRESPRNRVYHDIQYSHRPTQDTAMRQTVALALLVAVFLAAGCDTTPIGEMRQPDTTSPSLAEPGSSGSDLDAASKGRTYSCLMMQRDIATGKLIVSHQKLIFGANIGNATGDRQLEYRLTGDGGILLRAASCTVPNADGLVRSVMKRLEVPQRYRHLLRSGSAGKAAASECEWQPDEYGTMYCWEATVTGCQCDGDLLGDPEWVEFSGPAADDPYSGGGGGGGGTASDTDSSPDYDTPPEGIDPGYYQTLTLAERVLCVQNVYGCYVTWEGENLASAWGASLPENYQGIGDAARHAGWMAYITARAGASFAAQFGLAHESRDLSSSDPAAILDANMDLANNAVGVNIGQSVSSWDDIQEAVQNAGRAGQLSCILVNNQWFTSLQVCDASIWPSN